MVHGDNEGVTIREQGKALDEVVKVYFVLVRSYDIVQHSFVEPFTLRH
jgi:hypothetical protein